MANGKKSIFFVSLEVNMKPKLYKFSGAGNDFVLVDGREGDVERFREKETIGELCRRFSTDGLMILGNAAPAGEPGNAKTVPETDFSMEFFNPDGTGGMMCGNGGRCIVAFADMLGIKPSGDCYVFMAGDGLHTAKILDKEPGGKWTVRLKMTDVQGVQPVLGGYFTNTGTRHFVKFVPDVNAIDINADGPRYRHDPAFAPEGANANFVQVAQDGLHVRTFEKGVEGETLACGTGITASSLVASFARKTALTAVPVQCRRGDWLKVEFEITGPGCFRNVYLTGPATLELINEE
jgi:diaminopimelate epimerase